MITLTMALSDKTTPNRLIFTFWIRLYIFGKTASTVLNFLQKVHVKY